jgi:hypothetical protein
VSAAEYAACCFFAYPARAGVTIATNVSIEPLSVAELLAAYDVPRALTLLKVDIDSTDLGVAVAILDAGYSPAFIHMEVNTCFPPPLRFSVPLKLSLAEQAEYGTPLWKLPAVFYGASLSAIDDALAPRGYALAEVDGWDAVWVRADVARVLPPLPASTAEAFADGFTRFVDASPQCFNETHVPKVVNLRLRALAAGVAAAALRGARAEVDALLAAAREYVDAFAPPRRDTGLPMPYELAAAAEGGGPARKDATAQAPVV